MDVTSAEIHPAWLNCGLSNLQSTDFSFLKGNRKVAFFKHEDLHFHFRQTSSAE